MSRVRNKKIIGRVAWKSMVAKKSRNIIAVLAIALTSVLFTSLFTIGSSMVSKQQESTMRQVGGSAHSGYKYLCWEEYERLKEDDALKEVSYRIPLADAENQALRKLHTEMSYYEDLDAKMSFCYPEHGTMPKEKYDLVTSDLVLKALGIQPEIGAKVPIEFTVHGKTYQQEFRLSGWFKGDRISQAQVICLSREYVTEIVPVATESAMGKSLNSEEYPGRIMADFNFRSSLNLEKQLEELSARLGFEAAKSGINWAYLGAEMDMEVVVLLAVLFLVIGISGYLIIYNIFYINVFSDIRYYGLLKTIGTTGKQLKRMVRRQAWLLSAAGIPIGLIAGVFIGKLLLPVIMGHLTYNESADAGVVLSPLVFAGAAVFSLVTVYISCIRPCRTAAKVSPVEAVRFTEGQQSAGAGRKSWRKMKGQKKRGRKTRKVTPASFALANMGRSRKKAAVVVCSLSISLVLLNSIYSLVSGFDMDQFISNSTISDYMVADGTTDNLGMTNENRVFDGVTKEFQKALQQQNGIEETGDVYLKEEEHFMGQEERRRIQERIFNDKEKVFKELLKMYGEDEMEHLKDLEQRETLYAKLYGIDQMIFDKMSVSEGKLDWEKFRTGNYIITNVCDWGGEGSDPVPYYHPGEKVTLTGADGVSKEFEVLAVGEIPYAVSNQSFGIVEGVYVMPTEAFLTLYPDTQPMRTLFNVEKSQEDKMEQWLSDYCENVESNLTYTSKATIVAEFASVKNMYMMVGGLLAFVLAVIGILNFINTIVTSILSRRQEFAMIEAVGMTGGQMRRMLMIEGGCYALFTVIAALILSLLLNVTVIRNLGQTFFFFKWNLTVLPILICIPVLVIVVIAVPVICYRNMRKKSVVERIRVAD